MRKLLFVAGAAAFFLSVLNFSGQSEAQYSTLKPGTGVRNSISSAASTSPSAAMNRTNQGAGVARSDGLVSRPPTTTTSSAAIVPAPAAPSAAAPARPIQQPMGVTENNRPSPNAIQRNANQSAPLPRQLQIATEGDALYWVASQCAVVSRSQAPTREEQNQQNQQNNSQQGGTGSTNPLGGGWGTGIADALRPDFSQGEGGNGVSYDCEGNRDQYAVKCLRFDQPMRAFVYYKKGEDLLWFREIVSREKLDEGLAESAAAGIPIQSPLLYGEASWSVADVFGVALQCSSAGAILGNVPVNARTVIAPPQ